MASQRSETNLASGIDVPDEDVLRAHFYAILAHLLTAPPSAETLESVRTLEGDETEMGRALGALAAVAAKTSVEAAEEEYNTLFIGMARGELAPYASYYLAGFLMEKPLAKLRGDMAQLGIAASEEFKEPEDHIGIVCEMMHGLITGAFGAPADVATQKEFFDAHIRPWATRFFEDLEASKSAVLYMPVGTVGRVFMAIETEAFAMGT
jgi:TorA maturation chaperone TorD